VTDSGGGIPENIRDKVGQPFFTTKQVAHGTGLGLSISKGIVEAHGGHLNLDVECEHTRFVVTLPKAMALKNEPVEVGK
jgi:signal transduction histidine kinase